VKVLPTVVPAEVVIFIVPVVAPTGTVNVMVESLTTVKLVTVIPFIVIEVVPVKYKPLIVTVEPTMPLLGEKEVIVAPERVGSVVFLQDKKVKIAIPNNTADSFMKID
jgi:hypothetical protein